MGDIKIKPSGLSEELKEEHIHIEKYKGKTYYCIEDMIEDIYFGVNDCCDFCFLTEYNEEYKCMYIFGGLNFRGFNRNRDDDIIICEFRYLYDDTDIDDLKAKYKKIVQDCNKAYESWVREFISNFTERE